MCPPGTDQTERGAQQWQILAPRIKKVWRLEENRIFSDYSFERGVFQEERSCDLWFKLARSARVSCNSCAPPTACRSSSLAVSRLESLPAELLALILQQSSLEKSDILALGLTSELLWLHVLQHIKKICRRAVAPLAGVEIACTGTYLTDLPKPFVKDDLFKSSVRQTFRRGMCEARRINWAAREEYNAIDENPEETWRTAFEAHNLTTAGIPGSVAMKMAGQFACTCSMPGGSDPDALWALRNLTTKEFVRCRPGTAFKGKHGYVDHPDMPQLRVDDVLLLRICWTKFHPRRDSKVLRFRCGAWAGHCFDIVPIEEASTVPRADGWKDRTDEVVREAMTVSEAIEDKMAEGAR